MCQNFGRNDSSWPFVVTIVSSRSETKKRNPGFLFLVWLRTVNNVRTIFERQNEYIYIPDLREFANL